MRGTFRIATIRGIPIRVHFSLIIAFVLLATQLGALGLPVGVLLFASVLLHELGHSVVAQRLGIRIAAIDLHLLGGAALMTDQPDEPREEIMIAAAGPAVSLVLGLIALPIAITTANQMFVYAAAINLGMAVFNMLPALPMDGGRIFRALLARKMGMFKATKIAATTARVLAVGMGLFGLFGGNWSLMLIGVFVYSLAGREEQAMLFREAQRRAEQLRLQLFWNSSP